MSVKQEIFRDEAIDRAASPDQLNDYIKISSPSVWAILSAIIVLLIGVCFWGIFGRIESKIDAVAVIENNQATIYVAAEHSEKISAGATVRINESDGIIHGNASEPLQIDNSFNEYALYVGGLAIGEWQVPFTAEISVPDGVYKAQIVIETTAPVSFLVN